MNIASFLPTQLLQSLPQRRDLSLCRRIGLGIPHQNTDTSHPVSLLGARCEWPSNHTAEKRDELAPPHSITSSARPSNVTGKVMPNALAVLRLMTNSTFTACWIGRSAGLLPLRIFPA